MTGCPIALSVDDLMQRSRAIAGVDIIDAEIIEPLTIIHHDLNTEAELDEEGARGQERKLLRLLANRLRMKRDFQRHPEIAREKIKAPLIIMGVARSGTTKLQKLLAASGDFNWLPFWRNYHWASLSGGPGEPETARIAEADAFCRWYKQRSPEARLGHSFEALEPEEESVLSEGSFVAPSFVGYAELPNYARWLATQPPRIRFEFIRDVLRYLQWQGLADPDSSWLLKSANYNGLELEILKIFPDARFVMAHRSPLETLTSMCKFVQCLRQAYSPRRPDLEALVAGNYASMRAHLSNRRAHPDLPILDLLFEEIVGDVSETLNKIYAFANKELTGAARENMLTWDRENAMHKLGAFKYSLSEMGLDGAAIRENMAGYFSFLDQLKSNTAAHSAGLDVRS